MALYFLGRSDEAMEIEAFRTEFLARFKDQIDRRRQEPEPDGSAKTRRPAALAVFSHLTGPEGGCYSLRSRGK